MSEPTRRRRPQQPEQGQEIELEAVHSAGAAERRKQQEKKLRKIRRARIRMAAMAVCAAVALFSLGLGDDPDKIIIGSIIRLVPGIALTTSIRDFLGGDYLSGTIRMIDAFLIGGCIAIGVGVVVMLYTMLTGGVLPV